MAGVRSCHFRGAPGEWRKVGAEGRVEPLDIGGVDDGAGGRRGQDRLDAVRGPAHDPASDPDDVPLGGMLDDLGKLERIGQHQRWPTPSPGADRPAKDPEEGGDVAGQAVDADQDGRRRRAGPDPPHQSGDQGQITLATDHPAQPQPRRRRQCQGHPDLAADLLDPQLVRLHMLEVELSLLHQVLVHPLAVLPGLRQPACHRSFIEPERGDDGLRRAARGQQRQHQGQQLGRLVQPIEGRADPLSERSAGTADTGTAPLPDCGSGCSHPRRCRAPDTRQCGRIALAGPWAASSMTECDGCVTWDARWTRFVSTSTPPSWLIHG